MANLDLSTLTVGVPAVSTKGATYIPLFSTDESAVYWQPDVSCHPCFQPSAYNDAASSRVNISLSTPTALEKQLTEFDTWSIAILAQNSLSFFGETLTETQVRASYQASVRISEKGLSSWKLKMNTVGRNRVRCFDERRAIREMPANWVDVALRPRVLFKGFWVMGKASNREMGLLCELEACQITEHVKLCPF